MAAIALYPSAKYQFMALEEVVPSSLRLLALEVCKHAFNSAGEKKLTTFFFAKERGVTDEDVHAAIEHLLRAEFDNVETVASPKGDVNYKLALTAKGLKAFVDAKAESAKAFAEWQAKQA